MMFTTRRDFLATASASLAGLVLHSRSLPAAALTESAPPSAYLPDPPDASSLRALALHTIDAARAAGAQYADVRIGNRRSLMMNLQDMGPLPMTDIGVTDSFGVRVLVDGCWGFAFGVLQGKDALASSAVQAVNDARNQARAGVSPGEFLPVPVVTGEWDVPVKVDPFAVPVGTQVSLMGAFKHAPRRDIREIGIVIVFQWIAETRVFASTEGSLVTQRFTRALPQAQIIGHRRHFDSLVLQTPGLEATSAGYEVVLQPDLQERIKTTADDLQRLWRIPQRQLDVGRYDAVFDGQASAALFGETVSPALELDRALGEQVESAGSSFLAPPERILGAPIFSPLLSAKVDLSLPNIAQARWDDEGSEMQDFSLIDRGEVVDYISTRSTAPVLHAWYRQRGIPLRSRGCGIAWSASRPPAGYAGHVTVLPGNNPGTTTEQLCREMQQGLLVRYVARVASDQQLSAATLQWAIVYEISKGVIASRVRGNLFSCKTLQSWKELRAVGDASTTGHHTRNTMYGNPWWAITQTISAPAVHLSNVAVTNIPRRSGG
jgi:TldD protein